MYQQASSSSSSASLYSSSSSSKPFPFSLNFRSKHIIIPCLFLSLLSLFYFFSSSVILPSTSIIPIPNDNFTNEFSTLRLRDLPSPYSDPEPSFESDGSISQTHACTKLLKKPIPFRKCTKNLRNSTTKFCHSGQPMMHGQFQQDYYIYLTHFKYLPQHRHNSAIYVDIAAHEPMEFSNTWFFDACLNWRGLCVEANQYYNILLKKQRRCDVIEHCVGATENERVRFVLAEGRGGIEHTNKNMDDLASSKKYMWNDTIDMTCRRMDLILNERQIQIIDFLSLDVEGHELNVLKGFDWNRVRINVMSVEGNEQKDDIKEFLEKQGYKEHVYPKGMKNGVLTMSRDQVYIHNSVVWGKPL